MDPKPSENYLEDVQDYSQDFNTTRLYKLLQQFQEVLRGKSFREAEHAKRVSVICRTIAEAMELPEDMIAEMEVVGLIHDIGKVLVPDKILNKLSGLTVEERKVMSRHPEIGYKILYSFIETRKLARYVKYHHEHYDGKGYPAGLRGEEIPLQSRILTIADAFDAMTSERVYREALTKQQALQELRCKAGTQFDPYIVSIFLNKVIARLS
ncbi:MAG TPA: HD-GYP domain-containing protein [Firmicutes bacterium]|jgi:HD-GYP domain-containing protein (c-di-GMP phosphodiesterase class II)|nr:HD-GYP domain-containing protein [Bacillota bacterium]